jgi:hypothetical protein
MRRLEAGLLCNVFHLLEEYFKLLRRHVRRCPDFEMVCQTHGQPCNRVTFSRRLQALTV